MSLTCRLRTLKCLCRPAALSRGICPLRALWCGMKRLLICWNITQGPLGSDTSDPMSKCLTCQGQRILAQDVASGITESGGNRTSLDCALSIGNGIKSQRHLLRPAEAPGSGSLAGLGVRARSRHGQPKVLASADDADCAHLLLTSAKSPGLVSLNPYSSPWTRESSTRRAALRRAAASAKFVKSWLLPSKITREREHNNLHSKHIK